MAKKSRRRKGKLIQKKKDWTISSQYYRVIGVVEGTLEDFGVYPSLPLAKSVAQERKYSKSKMTCFVYTDDNRIVFSTEGKE